MKIMRRLGALTLLVVGGVHLQQYLAGYKDVPTIGALFLLNAIGAAVVAIGLLMPLERVLGGRRADLAAGLLSTLGAMIAVGALAALFISESQPLFGFMEDGYSNAIVIAIVSEAITAILLLPVAATAMRRAASGDRPPRYSRVVQSTSR
jgi:multisubunit Na+/H+ antiporter MnhG subunit